MINHFSFSIHAIHAVQECRIHHFPRFGIVAFDRYIAAFYHLYNREIKVFCKRIISAVVSGYRHYSTSSVTSQYIITDPDRHMCSSYWMKCIGTSKTPTDGFRIRHSITFTARCSFFFVGCHGLAPLGCGHFAYKLMFRSKCYECGAKYRIWSGREYLYLFRMVLNIKEYCGSDGFADPIALRFFQRIAPIDPFESL